MSDERQPWSVAYLGPRGTFSEQAALEYVRRDGLDAELVDYPTITTAAEALVNEEVDCAVIPYENSTGGGVGETHNFLIHHPNVLIRGEVIIPIEQCLILQPQETRAGVRVIYSHPQALNQCQHYLARVFPSARLELSPSTAEAVNLAREHGPGAAAIAPRRAAELFGGVVEQAGIEDDSNNRTRFIAIAAAEHGRTGADRTTLHFSTKNEIGALHRVLGHFLESGINLTRIESRPRPGRWGDYLFFVDFDGHAQDERVQRAYAAIRASTELFYHRGSYPRAEPPTG